MTTCVMGNVQRMHGEASEVFLDVRVADPRDLVRLRVGQHALGVPEVDLLQQPLLAEFGRPMNQVAGNPKGAQPLPRVLRLHARVVRQCGGNQPMMMRCASKRTWPVDKPQRALVARVPGDAR